MSGFHDLKLRSPLRQQDISSKLGYKVTLCDSCYNRILWATSNNEDLTMVIFESWANESGEIRLFPESLKRSFLKRAKIVHLVNEKLGKVREQEKRKYRLGEGCFPIILLDSNIKNDFVQTLCDASMIQNNLHDVSNAVKRGNIALILFAGCLDATKTFRAKYVSSELKDNGSRKEIPYTPDKRKETFIRIGNKAAQDCIYNAGVEAALVWKLKILKDVREICLEGLPNDSSIRNCLKEKKLARATENDILNEEP
jgi:hypothetical protein